MGRVAETATAGPHPPAIETHALRKVYPAPPAPKRGARTPPPPGMPQTVAASPGAPGQRREIVALHGLDLVIPSGEFFGLLGPNGAGKTTSLGILTTRIAPSGGSARVAGADVVTEAVQVRRRIGVVPQRPNPDRGLSVIENLVFHAAYFGIARSDGVELATRYLTQLGIADRARSKVDELSGGQQQRLMIARALIHQPSVIFLDEPTVGLDPQARHALWEILVSLHREGRTIVMTTHYMEEADRLCDRLAIIDQGKLLEIDTPAALKAKAPGGTMIELELDGDASTAASKVAAIEGVLRAEATGSTLRAYSDRAGRIISPVIEAVGEAGRAVRHISLAEPSLETLFISRTGRKFE
jgi:ABC-2 type transport system ATP-binding protein